jgi:Domain of unknown function (DUF4198)
LIIKGKKRGPFDAGLFFVANHQRAYPAIFPFVLNQAELKIMMISLRLILAILTFATALSCTAPAHAHEFWMQARPANPPNPSAKSAAELSLHVGQYFEGEQLPFTSAYVFALRHYGCGEQHDLMSNVPAGLVVKQYKLQPACAGTQLIAMDSHPNLITLPADKFTAYLHDEGLDDIIARREAKSEAAKPGRERFRRNVKTLIAASAKDPASARTQTTQTAQRLQIVPAQNTLAQAPGAAMRFQILFDGNPLADRLVKAWYKHDGQTLLIRAQSDAGGHLIFNFPYAGPWMLSVVHMIAANETAEADWDSYWGNLTFELPGRGPSDRKQAAN